MPHLTLHPQRLLKGRGMVLGVHATQPRCLGVHVLGACLVRADVSF